MTNDSDNNSTFIKPIQKKPTTHLPVLASSPAAPTDYDPTRRLGEELSLLNKTYQEVASELAALKERQDNVETRPPAATLAQVEALANQKRPLKLDAEDFARHVQPALVASLPSSKQLQAAAQAGADAIKEAGLTAADQIRQAGASAASRVEQATVVSRNRVLGWLGFASWKHAILLAGIPLVLAGAASLGWYKEYEQRIEMQEQVGRWVTFRNWMQKYYPAQWQVYTDQHLTNKPPTVRSGKKSKKNK